ncbi:MAG: class I SAM-dependent methyltransferase [Bacteroidia bacterium]|nr:class I SAM-dependent methyltransferase [Bacteroidia bacterium]
MIKQYLSNQFYKMKYKRAARAFNKALSHPYYLEESNFNEFMNEYGKIEAKPFQDYSVPAMELQANKRCDILMNKLDTNPACVLEIGPGAGYVLKEFKNRNVKNVFAVDIVDQLYQEVKDAGVELLLTSAENIAELKNESVDLIFSWGTLEHIPEPQKVLNECFRILRPGGKIYMEFGPLYYSPWGYHHQAILRLPYFHILFPEMLIHNLSKQKRPIDYIGYLPWVSGNPLEVYRKILKNIPCNCLVDTYKEGYDWYATDLIQQYPGVFKSKNVPFENFFVDSIKLGITKKFIKTM